MFALKTDSLVDCGPVFSMRFGRMTLSASNDTIFQCRLTAKRTWYPVIKLVSAMFEHDAAHLTRWKPSFLGTSAQGFGLDLGGELRASHQTTSQLSMMPWYGDMSPLYGLAFDRAGKPLSVHFWQCWISWDNSIATKS